MSASDASAASALAPAAWMLRRCAPKISTSQEASKPRLYKLVWVLEPLPDKGGRLAWPYSAEAPVVGMALAFSRFSPARDCCSRALATLRLGLAASALSTSSLSKG